ncbi:TlpA family protein disulfide reductase [Halobacteriota archaeon]
MTPTPTPTPTTESTWPLAPDFELIDATSGDLISLRDYRGKMVLLDLFATWCGACANSIDNDLVPLHEQYGDHIIILSVDIRDPDLTAEDLRTFAEEHDMGWPVLMGSSTTVPQDYKIQGLPTIYIIDKDGVIKYFHLGSPGIEVLKNEIDSLL